MTVAHTLSIDEPVQPVSDDFVSSVLAVVGEIPPGQVMTYGDVAATIGSRAARAVGTVLARYGSEVAWWRVIRSGGHPPVCHEGRALEHYTAESTPLRWMPDGSYRVNLTAARPDHDRLIAGFAQLFAWFRHPFRRVHVFATRVQKSAGWMSLFKISGGDDYRATHASPALTTVQSCTA